MATSKSIIEQGERMVGAVKDFVARALTPILLRTADLELKVGALGLVIGRGEGSKAVKEVEAVLAPLLKVQRDLIGRLDLHAQRIQKLEARGPALKFVGVWREGVGHEPGNVVTHDGSMWHAEKATIAKPGTSSDWVLCVKHGRDLR